MISGSDVGREPVRRSQAARRRRLLLARRAGGRRVDRGMSDPTPGVPTHEPVMLDEVVRLLASGDLARERGGALRIVDLTLGLGGHARGLLDALPHARLIGLDRDPRALAIATRNLSPFGERARALHARFSDLPVVLRDQGWDAVDVLLADLGLSSLQLDAADRGFSFMRPAALDMRMDPTRGETAADLIARLSVEEMTELLREFGEEPEARRIARALCASPAGARPRTTDQLRAAVAGAVRQRARRHDPSTLTFQGLRIAVNRELGELDDLLTCLPSVLAPGARVAILAYHSLEDRRVKVAFRSWTASCVCPPGLPVCRCGNPRALRLTRGAAQPSQEEIARNPRSRSARLRAVEWTGGR